MSMNLYHYTKCANVNLILENLNLRMTRYDCFKDKHEARLLLDDPRIPDHALKYVYITSFSMCNNVKFLWKKYSKYQTCIEFDMELLLNPTPRRVRMYDPNKNCPVIEEGITSGFLYNKCEYIKKGSTRHLELKNEAIEYAQNAGVFEDDRSNYSYNMLRVGEYINVKNKRYKKEQEYRVWLYNWKRNPLICESTGKSYVEYLFQPKAVKKIYFFESFDQNSKDFRELRLVLCKEEFKHIKMECISRNDLHRM